MLKSLRQFPVCQADFWQVNISHLVLSGHANLSHNFTKLAFVTSSLLFPILRNNQAFHSQFSLKTRNLLIEFDIFLFRLTQMVT